MQSVEPKPFATIMTWLPIEHRPLASGKYIIAHRGHAESDSFLSPEDKWAPGARLGWQRVGADGLHGFRPTHCAPIPDFNTGGFSDFIARARAEANTAIDADQHVIDPWRRDSPLPNPFLAMSEACRGAFDQLEREGGLRAIIGSLPMVSSPVGKHDTHGQDRSGDEKWCLPP